MENSIKAKMPQDRFWDLPGHDEPLFSLTLFITMSTGLVGVNLTCS